MNITNQEFRQTPNKEVNNLGVEKAWNKFRDFWIELIDEVEQEDINEYQTI